MANKDYVDGVKPEEVFNPSSGLLYRNPTHLRQAEEALDQSEIVKIIRNLKRERKTETFTYEETNPAFMPGFKEIRSMSTESIERMFKSLMRARPNIFKISVVLGDYPSAVKLVNAETNRLNGHRQRTQTELAEIMGKIMGNKDTRVVAMTYTVHDSSADAFSALGEVYGRVSEEEYANDENFHPVIEITYFS